MTTSNNCENTRIVSGKQKVELELKESIRNDVDVNFLRGSVFIEVLVYKITTPNHETSDFVSYSCMLLK